MPWEIEADFKIEGAASPTSQTSVTVTTEPDGTLQVKTAGAFPRVTAGQARSLIERASAFVQVTGQTITVTRGTRTVLSIHESVAGAVKSKIHWWSLLRSFVAFRNGE